jgi:hypothetical protein
MKMGGRKYRRPLYAKYPNPIPSQINMESENLFNSAHNPAFQAHLDAVRMGG